MDGFLKKLASTTWLYLVWEALANIRNIMDGLNM